MEISDYLRAIRRRLAVLILIPLLAAGAAAAWVLTRPPAYASTATVASGTLVGGEESLYAGAQGTAQFVAAFTETATGPVVSQEVQKATGVSAGALTDRLEVAQVGASADMTVSFTSGQRDVPPEVVRTVVTSTLTRMFKPRADLAAREATLARESVDTARAARTAYVNKVKIADPERAYDATLSSIAQLEQQQAYMRSVGNATGADNLQSAIDAQRTSLASFLPVISEYSTLSDAVTSAETDLNTAAASERRATVQLSAATGEGTTYVSPSRLQDVQTALIGLVLPVFGAGVLLAIVAALVLEALRPRRRVAPAAAPVPGGRSEVRAQRDAGLRDPAEPLVPGLGAGAESERGTRVTAPR